jgi:DNA-binding NarL/FixJ family response regulator
LDVLIVDDDFGARCGLAQTLKDLYPSASVHEARSLAQAIDLLTAMPQTGLVLLDLNIDDSRGIQTLKSLKKWCEDSECNPRIVVVSAAADYDDSLIPDAIENCATGFIVKGTSIEIFKSAIDLTLAGAIYIPERYLRSKRKKGAAPGGDEVNFTSREKQVAALLIQGLTYKQIARRLAEPNRPMSDNTVRVHVQRIAWKLRVNDDVGNDGLAAKAAVITAFADRRLKFALEA